MAKLPPEEPKPTSEQIAQMTRKRVGQPFVENLNYLNRLWSEFYDNPELLEAPTQGQRRWFRRLSRRARSGLVYPDGTPDKSVER